MKLKTKEYFDTEGGPLKCTKCESEHIDSTITASDECRTHEAEFFCKECKHNLGYWAYGHFDPEYMMAFDAS